MGKLRMAPTARARRGSRKHALELASNADFRGMLQRLVAPANATIPAAFRWKPMGIEQSEESDVRAFCRNCAPPGVDLTRLNEWWVSETFKGPTWDLLAECNVGDAPGMILVEAKAHESELDYSGKKAPEPTNAQAVANHGTIERCLADAEAWYRRAVSPECRITATTHYQLANRLAAAATLASCGMHVVLVYLGFTGDTYFDDHLKNDEQWQGAVRRYLEGAVPQSWPGQVTAHESGGSVSLLIRSLPVSEPSRPKVGSAGPAHARRERLN